MLLLEISVCSDASCQFCTTQQHLRTSENVVQYVDSDTYKGSRIPEDTAQCYQIQGWRNFTRNVFGIDQNICTCHALGDVSPFVCINHL
jgi:hypothetical protein